MRASEHLLAFPLIQPKKDSSNEDPRTLEKSEDSGQSNESNLNLGPSMEASVASTDEYVQLQQRIFRAALLVSALAVSITAFFFDNQVAISLLIGALSGILYLRLLARSIGKLGTSSKSVSKIQLVVPVVLVLAVSKLSQLELLPALLGFLLYKPSLIFQVLLESRSRSSS